MTEVKGKRVSVPEPVTEYHRWRAEDVVYLRLLGALHRVPVIECSTNEEVQRHYDRIRESLDETG